LTIADFVEDLNSLRNSAFAIRQSDKGIHMTQSKEATIFPVTTWDTGAYSPFELILLRLHYHADPLQENPTASENFAFTTQQAKELISQLQKQIADIKNTGDCHCVFASK
jgi:hypothetical protein